MIRDVTDLKVYTHSLILLKKLVRFLDSVSDNEIDIKRQCKKCGVSIPANIAEGFAKRSSHKEFKRFLKISIGSSDELITHLRTISIILPEVLKSAEVLEKEYKILSKRINRLHSTWISDY